MEKYDIICLQYLFVLVIRFIRVNPEKSYLALPMPRWLFILLILRFVQH